MLEKLGRIYSSLRYLAINVRLITRLLVGMSIEGCARWLNKGNSSHP